MIVDLGNGKFQLKSKDGSRVLLKEGTREEVVEAEKRANEHKDEADPKIEVGVARFDLSELKPLQIDPVNGWARADGFLGRSGLLKYYRGGKPWIEYRPPDEAFHSDSLASFAGAPLTNGHPPPNPKLGGAQLLDASNTRDFQVGHIVGTPRQDGTMVRADMLITDEAAIEDLQRGRAQLSCGYLADVDPTPGEIDGQRYDAVQRNVRGNHVALVAEGRAGPQARVRVDSLQLEPVASNHEQGDHAMKIRIDGVTYEVECKDASFEQAWSKSETARADEAKRHQAELDKARSDAADAASKAKSDLDKQTARADSAEAAVKAKTDELEAAPAAIRAQLETERRLVAIGVEVLGADAKVDEMDGDEIMRAVVLAVTPEAKLDDVSSDYLAARFDGALDIFNSTSALQRGSGPRVSRADDEEDGDEDEEDMEEKEKFKKASAEAAKPKKKK